MRSWIVGRPFGPLLNAFNLSKQRFISCFSLVCDKKLFSIILDPWHERDKSVDLKLLITSEQVRVNAAPIWVWLKPKVSALLNTEIVSE